MNYINYLLLFALVFIIACHNYPKAQENEPAKEIVKTSKTISPKPYKKAVAFPSLDSAIENKIDSLIWQLPEVQKVSASIDSISNHQHGVTILVEALPSKNYPFYWMKAGFMHYDTFETYFNFYVNEGSFEIKYLDVNETKGDGSISLEEWRKRQKTNKQKIKTYTY